MQTLAEAEDEHTTANIRTQLISLWTVPTFGLVLVIAFLAFPGFFPPMSPAMSAEQVAAFYTENRGMIWFSMITFNICGIMLLPLFMVIVVQMKRMATQSHVFAYCYLTAAVSGATLFALADIFFLVRRVPARPQSRTGDAAQRHGLDRLHRARRRARRHEPAYWPPRSTSTPARRIRCFRGGSGTIRWPPRWPWPPPSAPRYSHQARWRGMGRCRSGCATVPSHSSCW